MGPSYVKSSKAHAMTDLRIGIDLSHAERAAMAMRERLIALRTKYDLGAYEYCKEVCIAPTVIPYSHPDKHTNQWRVVWGALERRYPDPPIGRGEGADTLCSTHLHLIVNWLEIEALGTLIGAEPAKEHVANLHYYRWIYASVLRDWQALRGLYASHYLVPILPAHDMSPEDLALAARLDEA